ncbi:MAG: hypothetical protein Greene101449_645 [Candidatus Peregrinibacteria bacterium Greene1014_49]|nr:MAG: hypothetical protein Greene101449_645 [Candidatus Peregrinibacteria bacterium Greene1014_49]
MPMLAILLWDAMILSTQCAEVVRVSQYLGRVRMIAPLLSVATNTQSAMPIFRLALLFQEKVTMIAIPSLGAVNATWSVTTKISV